MVRTTRNARREPEIGMPRTAGRRWQMLGAGLALAMVLTLAACDSGPVSVAVPLPADGTGPTNCVLGTATLDNCELQ